MNYAQRLTLKKHDFVAVRIDANGMDVLATEILNQAQARSLFFDEEIVGDPKNATLRSELSSSAFWAAFISYTAGMLTLLFVLVVTREPWPALSVIAKSSSLSWIGGIFGTVYIVASIMSSILVRTWTAAARTAASSRGYLRRTSSSDRVTAASFETST